MVKNERGWGVVKEGCGIKEWLGMVRMWGGQGGGMGDFVQNMKVSGHFFFFLGYVLLRHSIDLERFWL